MSAERDRTLEQRLRAAVESSPSGLLMVDSAGRLVLVNREVERMFGYSRDELLGESIERLVPGRFRDDHPGFRRGFMHEPRARAMGAGRDLYGVRKDGTEVPVEIGLNPVETDEGLFVLGSVVDITARKAAEAERHQLERQLRQAQKMEAVGTLAGGIAHDFNNILGAIVGYAELIERRIEDAQAQADTRDLLRQAERGRSLVQRLMAFSRLQETRRRPLDLAELVEDTRRLLRATLPASIEIRTTIPTGLPRVLADATGMQQILLNLGNNSAHAMPEGGALDIRLDSVYLRDSAARAHPSLNEGPHLVLSVSDTGVGMPPEVRERVFDPFFTTKPPGQGSGLGLPMVLGVVQEHEGALELESEEGKGTVVRCIFPILVDDDQEKPVAEPGVSRGDGVTVLYVDDEPALAALGRRRLESIGYEVHAVSDPREALTMFQASPERFDVVVTDLSMPGLSGIDLSQQIRLAAPEIPVILLTGFIDPAAVASAEAAGIRRVVQKPITLSGLAEVVESVVNAAKPRRDS